MAKDDDKKAAAAKKAAAKKAAAEKAAAEKAAAEKALENAAAEKVATSGVASKKAAGRGRSARRSLEARSPSEASDWVEVEVSIGAGGVTLMASVQTAPGVRTLMPLLEFLTQRDAVGGIPYRGIRIVLPLGAAQSAQQREQQALLIQAALLTFMSQWQIQTSFVATSESCCPNNPPT